MTSSIFQRVASGVSSIFSRSKALDPFVYVSNRATASGDAEVKSPYSESPWVFAAVRARARYTASVPIVVVEGSKRQAESKPLSPDSDWQRLVDRPSLGVSTYRLLETVSSCLALHGEAMLVAFGEAGAPFVRGDIPREIVAVDPRTFEPTIAKDGTLLGWKSTAFKAALTVDQVCLVASFNPDSAVRGVSPLQCVLLSLGFDLKAKSYNSALLTNGADPGGIIYSDSPLSAVNLAALRAQWEDRHKGSIRASRLAILSGGLKYERSTITPKDMAFGEMLDRNKKEILAAIGVNQFDIGDSQDFNRASALAARTQTWESTIVPECRMLEDALWAWIFEPFSVKQAKDVWAVFDLSKIEALQPNMTEKINQATSLSMLGYTADQVNERLGLGMPETEADAVDEETGAIAIDSDAASVADTAMSRDQVTSLLSIVQSVSDGSLPAESAIAALLIAFPSITQEEAASLVEPARLFAESNEGEKPTAASLLSSVPYVAASMHKAYPRRTSRHVLAVRRRLMQLERRKADEIIERLSLISRLSVRAPGDLRPLTASELNLVLGTSATWAREARAYLDGVLDPVALYALHAARSQFGGFDVVDIADPKWIAKAAQQTASLVKVQTKRREAFRKILVRVFAEEGAGSIDEISRRLKAKFGDEIPSSADTVARTESAMLIQDVKDTAAKSEGFTHKTWSTAGDLAVRASHAAIDGETVEISSKFSNGLQFPSQLGGPAEEVINCRCDVVYRVID